MLTKRTPLVYKGVTVKHEEKSLMDLKVKALGSWERPGKVFR